MNTLTQRPWANARTASWAQGCWAAPAMCIARIGDAIVRSAVGAAMAGLTILAATVPTVAADCKTSPRQGIDWSACDRRNLMLSGANLAGANLDSTDFTLTDLRNANLTSASLEKATLVRVSLDGAVADKANFTNVEAYRANLRRLSARGALFLGSEFSRADFSNADLAGSSFEKAELGRASFEGADLADTTFTFANLARANLQKVRAGGSLDFTGTHMFLTRIEGLDLSGARGLVQEQIDNACGDTKTTLPVGLSSPGAWPCASE